MPPGRVKNDLHDTTAARFGHGRQPLVESILGGDERLGIDSATGEQIERPVETPATGSDQTDLIDHYPRQIDRDGPVECRFEDQLSPGSRQSKGHLEPLRRPGGLDHHVEAVGRRNFKLVSEDRADRRLLSESKLLRVFADQHELAACRLQHPGDQLPELAIAENRDSRPCTDGHLVENLAGGGERLSKDGRPVRHPIGNDQQVADRKSKIVGKSSVPPDNPEHGSRQAVARISGPAEPTGSTSGIDLTDHPATYQRRIWRLLHHPDKFMAKCAAESGITTDNLEVRVTDAGHGHPHQRLPGGRGRHWKVAKL